MFKKYQKIHFVGIGGIGMSGIARVLMNLGYLVTGSDLKPSDTTRELSKMGAKIFKGHNAANIDTANVVVVSSAVSETNPEVREAKRKGVVVVPRAEMLAELMRLKYSVAVAGTHGKTSTTSLIGCICDRAGLDPTLIIGGKVNSLSSNARLGKGDYLIAEADESDRSFLKLTPTISVITNINQDHMENYADFADMQRAYVEFANKVPFYGAVIACSEHPVVRKILPEISRTCITYGRENADYTAKAIIQKENKLSFDVLCHGKILGKINLNMAGGHYVMNSLAAIAVGRYLDIPFATIKDALAEFGGIARRFQILFNEGPLVVDDYAHHPVEIAATIGAARSGWPKRPLTVVMQPHRFTRLAKHFSSFVSALKDTDRVVIMDVYSAGERPIKNYSGGKLWREVCKNYPKKRVEFAKTGEDVMTLLPKLCEKEDVILFLGAGNITSVAKNFVKLLI